MKLLTPAQMGVLSLDNHVVMAPMTRNRATGLVPGPLNALYYSQRATAGLIITEATQVGPMAQGYPETPGVYTDEQVAGWKQVTDAVHAAGGKIFVQLWHVGRVSHPSFHDGDLPVAPSAIRPDLQVMTYQGMKDAVTPRALETAEVADIVAQFRHAAEQAKKAGFDGVEVHGANGYLLDQFLQSGANQRNDQYGGSVENRARVLLEATEAVIDVFGPGRVGVRLSPGGTFNAMADATPYATWTYVANALNDLDLAYVHVIREPEAVTLTDPRGGETTARAIVRGAYRGTLITAGRYDRAWGEQDLQDGKTDLIAYGRPYVANPDLVARFALDTGLNAPDASTFYGGDETGFTDYPFLKTIEAEESVAA